MSTPAIVCFCKHDTGSAGLEQLFQLQANIRLVIVQAGFEDKPWYKQIQQRCNDHRIQLVRVHRLSKQPEVWELIEKADPAFAFTIMFTQIIPNEVISICKNKLVNFHPSLLPKYRGPHPVNWAIVNGEKESGVTAHFVTDVVDGGPILCQRPFPILLEDDNNTIQKKIDTIVVEQIKALYPKLLADQYEVTPQKEEESSYYRLRTPEDGRIDWSTQTTMQLYNLIRAIQYPLAGAFCRYEGEKFVIRRAQPVVDNLESQRRSGAILSHSDGRLVIQTIDGCLRVEAIENEAGIPQPLTRFAVNSKFENG